MAGTVSIDSGTLSAPMPLGIEADEPASMWVGDGALALAAQRSCL